MPKSRQNVENKDPGSRTWNLKTRTTKTGGQKTEILETKTSETLNQDFKAAL